jgi:hypothetical protein
MPKLVGEHHSFGYGSSLHFMPTEPYQNKDYRGHFTVIVGSRKSWTTRMQSIQGMTPSKTVGGENDLRLKGETTKVEGKPLTHSLLIFFISILDLCCYTSSYILFDK